MRLGYVLRHLISPVHGGNSNVAAVNRHRRALGHVSKG
jgi:hypothetical protein